MNIPEGASRLVSHSEKWNKMANWFDHYYQRFMHLLGGGGGVPGVVGTSTNSTSVVTKSCTNYQLPRYIDNSKKLN